MAYIQETIYKNGEYNKHFVDRLDMATRKKIEPTFKQLQYRDSLYKFCVEKQVVGDGFRLGRTNREISANIRGLISILKKHGLNDEFFARKGEQPAEG